ncbi:MAG: LysE family translocator [Moraxella sp.]|nr:LysE family translocator [Moraxella sp.]
MLLDTVKFFGAMYLIYLGWQCFTHTSGSLGAGKAVVDISNWHLFQKGVWVSLSNPKAILFFAAFFPKFINFSAPLINQYIVLIAGFFVIENFWQFVYAVGGKKLASFLNTDGRLRWLNRICGVIFGLIGLLLLRDIFW